MVSKRPMRVSLEPEFSFEFEAVEDSRGAPAGKGTAPNKACILIIGLSLGTLSLISDFDYFLSLIIISLKFPYQ